MSSEYPYTPDPFHTPQQPVQQTVVNRPPPTDPRIFHKRFLIVSSVLLLVAIAFIAYPSQKGGETYIRINQVGYLPGETKTAIIMSVKDISGASFQVLNQNLTEAYSGSLSDDRGPYLAFPHHFVADFSALQEPGRYTVSANDNSSPPFRIAKAIYSDVVETTLKFFRMQECGNINNEFRSPCHLKDATSVIGAQTTISKLDLVGSWHDAGDYTKYLITTAYASYFLLLSYHQQHALLKNGSRNVAQEALNEARVGTDWLLKLHYQPDRLIVQVSDARDHDVGWRLPEKDRLENNRPAYDEPSRAVCGIYAATMALAAKTFAEAGDPAYAARCLQQAREVFDLADTGIPNYSAVAEQMYCDKSYLDNLTLGATELYRMTGEQKYLTRAIGWCDSLEIMQWLSWGDLEGLAFARIGQYHPPAFQRLHLVLSKFDEIANSNPFGYPLESYPWGSLGQQTAVAAIALLYQESSGHTEFTNLILKQRDFLLGCNSHGVSFIGAVGTEYVRNFHHQIAMIKGSSLPGAVSEGYCAKSLIRKYNIELKDPDRFARFQTPDVVYYDDRNDYISNEPTIVTNAQTVYVLTAFVTN